MRASQVYEARTRQIRKGQALQIHAGSSSCGSCRPDRPSSLWSTVCTGTSVNSSTLHGSRRNLERVAGGADNPRSIRNGRARHMAKLQPQFRPPELQLGATSRQRREIPRSRRFTSRTQALARLGFIIIIDILTDYEDLFHVSPRTSRGADSQLRVNVGTP